MMDRSSLTWKPQRHKSGQEIFAWPGDKVVCPKGHVICEVAIPLHRKGGIFVSHFRAWSVPAPSNGSALDFVACRCGQPMFDVFHGNIKIRVNGVALP